MSNSLLDVEALSAGYGVVTVLRDVSFAVRPDAVVGVLGANGAGKSTLMRTLAGLIPVARGRVIFDGTDVTRLSAPARVRAGIALVPEGRMLFPTLSVWDHLWLGSNPRGLAVAAARG
jgi:branched-chain amino acid transport system ATP-binding protein